MAVSQGKLISLLLKDLKKWSKKLMLRNGTPKYAAKLLQSCPILCDPIDWQPTRLLCPWDSPGRNTGVGCHFLLQCMEVKSLSRVWLLATPWTTGYQAPLSMGFARQEYWSGVPLPSPPKHASDLLFWGHWPTLLSHVIICQFSSLWTHSIGALVLGPND